MPLLFFYLFILRVMRVWWTKWKPFFNAPLFLQNQYQELSWWQPHCFKFHAKGSCCTVGLDLIVSASWQSSVTSDIHPWVCRVVFLSFWIFVCPFEYLSVRQTFRYAPYSRTGHLLWIRGHKNVCTTSAVRRSICRKMTDWVLTDCRCHY